MSVSVGSPGRGGRKPVNGDLLLVAALTCLSRHALIHVDTFRGPASGQTERIRY